MTIKAALIGGGRMGQSMIKGWLKANLDIDFTLFDPIVQPDLSELLLANGWKINSGATEELNVEKFDLVLIAVKPQTFPKIGDLIAKISSEDTLVVSIMAGINIEKLAFVSGAKRVIRAMPNTPGQVGAGVTAYIGNKECSENDNAQVEDLLSPLGKVVKLNTENEIDAVTAVSGSGPAYIFLLAEAMAAAGQAEGLSADISLKLALETIYGSAKLLIESDKTPLELRKEVTSPNGTTAAAIDVLTAGGGLVTLMKNAINAAANRSRQLGKTLN